jgi:hypothetical protein
MVAPAPLPLRAKLGLVLALGLALVGCRPEIGDECSTSTDCSQNGDRLCDISQPGGYCFIYNCEPSGSNPVAKCPDEAACVAFATEPSPIPECANRLGATPYARSYCLKKCEGDDDCRSGYACLSPEDLKRWAAVDVDSSSSVCMVASSTPPPDVDASSQVCTASSGDAGGAANADTGGAAGSSSEAGGGGGGS